MDWFTGGGQRKMSPLEWLQGALNPFKGFNLNQLPSLNKSALESWIGTYGGGEWWNPLDWFLPKPVSAVSSGASKPTEFKWPKVDLLGWLPKIKLPEFKWPVLPMPDLSGWIPKFTWPQIPNINLPAWIPKFTWPKIPSLNLSGWIPRF